MQCKATTKKKDQHEIVHPLKNKQKKEHCLYSDQIIILIVELPALKYKLHIVKMNKDIRLFRYSQFWYGIHFFFDTIF